MSAPLCIIGFHSWVKETHGAYQYCEHCGKYRIFYWRTK